MRLLSWNVYDLQGDPHALHRVVRSAQADVVCLQEAPRRPGAGLRLRLLERGTQLRVVAGGRRSGGTALLVAPHVRVEWALAFRLPVTGRLTRTRGACVADLVVPDVGGLTVASVHLPLDAGERLDHVRRVADVARWRGRPAVIAGDLNEPAGAPAWRAWHPLARDPWADDPQAAPTYPARNPAVRIDALLAAPGLRVTAPPEVPWRAEDVRRASDHVPLLAEITPDSP